MPEPPPRKRFQFHLSTAIVMMFVAGGLMWANFREQRELRRDFTPPVSGLYKTVGWPFTAKEELIRLYDLSPSVGVCGNIYFPNTSYTMLILNVMNALLILFAGWFLCEWLIRRRAAHKEA